MSASRRDVLLTALALAIVAAETFAAQGRTRQPLRIAFVGSGHQGGALGLQFARAGHEVMFSSRHPETLRWVGKLAALFARHDALVEEMDRRGFTHRSPLDRRLAKGRGIVH